MHPTIDNRNPSVLVVGAGPAGLVAAITLARHGVDVLVIERRPNVSTLPRATNVSVRTMELLRSWGLGRAVRDGAVEVIPKGWLGETLGDPEGVEYEIGYPSAEEAAQWSPTRPAWVPQSHLEPVLLSHLVQLPGVELLRGVELAALRQRAGGLEVDVRDCASGSTRVLRPRYVIGADGIRSTVRTLLGIGFPGEEDVGRRDVALFRAPLTRLIGGCPYALNSVRRPRIGTFIPFGRNERWGFGAELQPGDRRFGEMTTREVAALIATAAGDPALPVEIEQVGPVTFGAQTADRFRDGRAFIVGDAAHRMTPRTGSGMNIAIHGAYDLGWKLAWVLRGWASPDLLDTYEAERRPVAEAATAQTVDPNGSERTVDAAMRADLGARVPHVWVNGPSGTVSTVDLVEGEAATVLAGPEGDAWRGAVDQLAAPVAVHRLDLAAAQALGVEPAGALVLRPDGVIQERLRAPQSALSGMAG